MLKAKNLNTNAPQFECLVDFMTNHKELATGFLKTRDARQISTKMWNNLASTLNSLGPPMRDGVGWKKVWSNYKNHIKDKARKNKQSISGTGGGPSRVVTFTATEEKVIELLNINDSVNRMEGTVCLGICPEASRDNRNVNDDNYYDVEYLQEESPQTLKPPQIETIQENVTIQEYHSPIKNSKQIKNDLLREQVHNQILYQKESLKLLSEINQNIKNISKTKKKTYKLKKKTLELLYNEKL